MGSTIDRAVLTALTACALYLIALNAGLGIPLSCAAAYGCMALIQAAYHRMPRRYRASAAQAEAALTRISEMDDADARAALEALSGEGDALECVIRYPGGSLSADDLFNLWRAHRGEDHIAVAATCPADPQAREFARTRANPSIALLDGRALIRVIRRTGQFAPEKAPPRRVRSRVSGLLFAPVRPGALLYGLSLWAVYLSSGWTYYLIAAVAVLAVTGVRFIHGLSIRQT